MRKGRGTSKVDWESAASKVGRETRESEWGKWSGESSAVERLNKMMTEYNHQYRPPV